MSAPAVTIHARTFRHYLESAIEWFVRQQRPVTHESLAMYTGIPLDLVRRVVEIEAVEEVPE